MVWKESCAGAWGSARTPGFRPWLCPGRHSGAPRPSGQLRGQGTWGAWQPNPPHDPAQGRAASCVALVLCTPAPHNSSRVRDPPARPQGGRGGTELKP